MGQHRFLFTTHAPTLLRPTMSFMTRCEHENLAKKISRETHGQRAAVANQLPVLLCLKAPARQSEGSKHHRKVEQGAYQAERKQQKIRAKWSKPAAAQNMPTQGKNRKQTLGTKP